MQKRSPFAGRRRHVSEASSCARRQVLSTPAFHCLIRCKMSREFTVFRVVGTINHQRLEQGWATSRQERQRKAPRCPGENSESEAQALRMVTNARRMSRAQGHRVTNLSARHKTTAHVEGKGEQKSNNNVPAGRTYRDKNILQILKGDAGEFSLFVDLEKHQYHVPTPT